ncbi:GerMN domain-containing protein [Pannus brasiliensis CCIBt3594]|uniref:GerMN domain-containing protein n=1 Tax=Pannus brasiliensis CCIBt3594 TaxID=1427578 RepID=A0AAW9QP91_9CHRO
MPPSRSNNSFPLGPVIGVGIALFITGGAAAWFTVSKLASRQAVTPSPSPIESPTIEASPVIPSPSIEPTPTVTASPSPVAVEPATETRSIYWLKVTDTGSELVPRSIEIRKSADKDKELESLFQSLLAGPIDAGDTTTIPAGTKLLSLKQDKKGIRLNLSREFTANEGADSLIGRLAQVLYTATSLDPKASVWIQVEGQPLELLGEGEGLEVAQPMTRAFFEQNYQLSGN